VSLDTGRLPDAVDEETREVVAYFAQKIRRATESARRGRPARRVATKAAAVTVDALRRIAFDLPPEGVAAPDVRDVLQNLAAALRRRGRPPGRRDAASHRMLDTRRVRLAVELERAAVVKRRKAETRADPRTRRLLARDPEAALSVDEVAIRRVARWSGRKVSTVRRLYYRAPE
jgi:hypothetical protein